MEQLKGLLLKNPTASTTVDPIKIQLRSDTQEGEDVPSTLCGWVPTPLEPPGPLAAILWKTNPEFRAGTPPVRRTILRETILALQVRVEAELKGHKWSRKKIIEQLASQQTADVSPPQDTKELDAALAYLYEIQLVFVDEANKKIRWIPEDVRQWSPARPVWAFSLGSRAIYHRKNEESVGNYLAKWASEREAESPAWRIEWPTADGTLEALKAKVTEQNISLGLRLEKPKKADYSVIVGRAEAIRHLSNNFGGVVSQVAEPMVS